MISNFDFTLEFDEDKCTGCQACVLACSYHRKKNFSLDEGSCIEVNRDNKEGTIKINYDSVCCDICEGEEEPLCIKFCSPGAIRIIKLIKGKY